MLTETIVEVFTDREVSWAHILGHVLCPQLVLLGVGKPLYICARLKALTKSRMMVRKMSNKNQAA